MFSKEVTTLPVLGESESNLFPNIIVVDKITQDVVLLGIIRALVSKRLPADRTLKYHEKFDLTQLDNTDRIHIVFADVFSQNERAQLDVRGWTELADLEAFIRAKLSEEVCIFIQEDKNSVILNMPKSMRLMHTMAFFVPRFFPALFKENKPDQTEIALLNSLLKPFPDDFYRAVQTYAMNTGLYGKAMAKKASMASEIFMKAQVNALQEELTNARDNVQCAFNTYRDAMRACNEATIKLEGARSLAEKNSKEQSDSIYEFLMENPHIRILDVTSDGEIELVIENYLDQYDADGFEIFADSFFEAVAYNAGWSIEDTKLLLNNVFSADPVFRVRTCGYYRLDARGWARTKSGYSYDCVDRIPNPHLDFHSCLGQHQAAIQERMMNGNIVAALVQCNASVCSVNIHETVPTFRPFCQKLLKEPKRVLEAADGKTYNAKEALEWLKNRKEEAAE